MHFTASGTRFMIGGIREDAVDQGMSEADFASEDWVEVESLISLGRLSGNWETRDFVDPGDMWEGGSAFNIAYKAVRPAKSMQIAVVLNDADAGQLALVAAEGVRHPFAFRIVLPTGAERLFLALVVGMEDAFEESNSVLAMTFDLVLRSNLVRVSGA